MKSDSLMTLLEVLVAGPLLAAAAALLALLFGLVVLIGLDLLGAGGRERLSGLRSPQESLKPGAHSAAINSSHH